jgi:7-keto-8-aminopelargonate synthetase-like enzyme
MQMLETAAGAQIKLDGRDIVNFAGSAYLGLAQHPDLINAGLEAIRRFGARPLMPPAYGLITQPHLDVETESARFFGTAASVYLPSGYLLGLATLTGLRSRFDLVLLDEDGHYNLRDAAGASGAQVRTFAHFDCDALESELARARHGNLQAFVAVDGMCPTFGTIPRLDVYAQLARKYQALLFVDESHSFGTLGASGRGAIEECGLSPGEVLSGGSLGKAFAAAGAVINGSTEAVSGVSSAPCMRGASAGMAAGAAMAAASLRLVRAHPEILAKLRENIKRLKTGMRQMGIEVEDTPAPLATFVAGTATQMQSMQQRLLDAGLFVLYLRYAGSGPQGAIRCSVFADHTHEQIDLLLEALQRCKP